jgi:hypothetical protein
MAFLTTDNKLYRSTGAAWTVAVPTTDLNGTITTAQIAALAVTAAQIANGTITGTQVAAATIAAANIVANTITAAQIATGTITSTQIAALTITAAQILAGTITSAQIAAATITGSNIAAATITAANILANTITAGQIAAGSIGVNELVAGAIETYMLSVQTDEYVRGTVYQTLGNQWVGPIANSFGASTLRSIAYGNGVFVAVSDAGKISRSVDLGVTWSALIANSFGASALSSIAYGNGVFVAVSDAGKISRSVDLGVTWSALIANPFGVSNIYSLAYNLGIFQAGTFTGKTARSYDNGGTWGSLVTNPFGTNAIYGIASSTTNMVAVGLNGSIATAGWNPCYSLVEPVVGEPSLGTKHKHRSVILNAGVPANTNVQTLNLRTVDATLPVGITWVEGELRATGTVVGVQFFVGDAFGIDYSSVETQIAALQNIGQFGTPVDAAGNIYWKATAVTLTSTIILMTAYYS